MIELLAITAALFFVLAIGAFIADRGMDRSVASGTPPRVDQRIPAEEMALTGDSIGDHVEDYFAKRSRQEQIIARTLGQDR